MPELVGVCLALILQVREEIRDQLEHADTFRRRPHVRLGGNLLEAGAELAHGVGLCRASGLTPLLSTDEVPKPPLGTVLPEVRPSVATTPLPHVS
jgi:hypothetical protein